jgi:hypothetical protein
VFVSFGLRNKPIGFVGYSGGIAAGTRAVEHLALIAVEAEAVPLRNSVLIPFVTEAFDEDGKPKSGAADIALAITLDDEPARRRLARALTPGAPRRRARPTAGPHRHRKPHRHHPHQGANMTTEQRLAERFAETLTAHDLDAFSTLLHPDYVNHNRYAEPGKAGSVGIFTAFLDASADFRVEVEDIIDVGTTIVGRYGSSPPPAPDTPPPRRPPARAASTSPAEAPPPATANSTETLLGAQNVRSIAATLDRSVIRRSTDPSTGCSPRINAMNPSRDTRPPSARPSAADPAPVHTPGSSPRPA